MHFGKVFFAEWLHSIACPKAGTGMKSTSKPNKRLVASVCCGVAAAILISIYLSSARAEALTSRESAIEEYGGETAEVYVATQDIAAGEVIEESDVELMEWLVDLLPEGAITELDDVVGKTALQAIYENEPVTTSMAGDASASVSVPDGLCAVSVPSEDVEAVGGALKPGSTVNVYAVGSSVQLIGEDILILETSISDSTDENSETVFGDASSRDSVSWVTLAVTPESVEELISASNAGTLYFALPGDDVAEDASDLGDSESQGAGSEDADAAESEEGGE